MVRAAESGRGFDERPSYQGSYQLDLHRLASLPHSSDDEMKRKRDPGLESESTEHVTGSEEEGRSSADSFRTIPRPLISSETLS